MARNGKLYGSSQQLPPSLNKVRGKSDIEFEEERVLPPLKDAIRQLPLLAWVQEEHVTHAARWLLYADWEVSYACPRAPKPGSKGPKRLRGVKFKRGRQPERRADYITTVAATFYQDFNWTNPFRNIDRDTGKPYGGFHNFLTEVFPILGIETSADAANMRLQASLARIRWPNQAKK